MSMRRFCILLALLGGIYSGSIAVAETKAGLASVPFAWIDDHEKDFSFQSLVNQQYVVAMVYASCHGACPLTVHKIEGIDKIAKDKKLPLKYVLVSFDSQRDTTEALNAFRKRHKLSDDQWILLHGSEQDVRKLSVLLGVSYQRDPETGEFSHSNQLTLIDKDGGISTVLSGLDSNPDPLIKQAEINRGQ